MAFQPNSKSHVEASGSDISQADVRWMSFALRLARKGYGRTSPNPMVGAVLVKNGRLIGKGWHRRAGAPHAEIEAFQDAKSHNVDPRGSTLYVTLEPCSTWGRTPPCTKTIISAGVKRVVIGTIDPNPRHLGTGVELLRRAGLTVVVGCLERKAQELNEAWNYWIQHNRPFVIVKGAMTLDGKIATATGESKWITGSLARSWAMRLRRGVDAVLVGVNTVLADDPSLTPRRSDGRLLPPVDRLPKRVVLDTMARTPISAKIVTDDYASTTVLVVGEKAPHARLEKLCKRVSVWVAPTHNGKIDLNWLLAEFGKQEITSVLVEGGGEINASFLLGGFAHRVVFVYGPKILGSKNAIRAVAGVGAGSWEEVARLAYPKWRRLGCDLLLTARVVYQGR